MNMNMNMGMNNMNMNQGMLNMNQIFLQISQLMAQAMININQIMTNMNQLMTNMNQMNQLINSVNSVQSSNELNNINFVMNNIDNIYKPKYNTFVIFHSPFGSKYSVNCNIKDKLKDVIKEYRNKSGDVKSDKFIYNAAVLDIEKTLEDYKFNNSNNVIVCIDQKNMIC